LRDADHDQDNDERQRRAEDEGYSKALSSSHCPAMPIVIDSAMTGTGIAPSRLHVIAFLLYPRSGRLKRRAHTEATADSPRPEFNGPSLPSLEAYA
jgi:hypothetical protein